jgi:twitching motility protein PilT
MAKIDAFFKLMNEQGASDLHLAAGQPPALRIRGDIERIKYKVLDNDDLRAMLYEISPEEKIKTFEETGDVDFGYEIPGLARYRANFFMQRNGIGAVFREIPSTIMTCDQLGIPAVVSKLATLPRGLVLVTGPTGCGKSTTLAAIIDVAVGEMRDLETISLAIEAASTGHLVFATLHTSSAWKTVDRIIEVFPATEQTQIRSTLADGLRAIIAQVLFKRVDKKDRCVALEILIANPAVRNLVREAKTHQIPSMIQTGRKYGMQLMDDAIMDLYNKGWISADEAYIKSNEKAKFRPLLTAPPADFTEV